MPTLGAWFEEADDKSLSWPETLLVEEEEWEKGVVEKEKAKERGGNPPVGAASSSTAASAPGVRPGAPWTERLQVRCRWPLR